MRLVLLLGLCALSTASAYHVLCVQGVPTRSHYNLVKGVANALLAAGHEVTMITPYPDKKPTKNLKFIDVSDVLLLLNNLDMRDQSKQSFTLVMEFARNISKTVMATPAVKEALVKNQYDAVVTEWFFSDSEAGYAAVQKVPWILLSTMALEPHLESLVDSVRSVTTVPVVLNPVTIPMTFWERVKNTLWYCLMTFGTAMKYSETESDYWEQFGGIAEARGVTLPPFYDALHNVSIMLVNSHPSYAPAKSIPPNVIEIAGYHISEEVPPLPKDLQELLDSSKQGVIYFSMGSSFKSALLPDKTKEDLVKLFGQLPYTVLWKFEEPLENLPKNLHIRPWLPQNSILTHPNVKLFISHGGLLSTLESLHFGMPTVAVPVFGDQISNAERSQRNGHAIKVDLTPNLAKDLDVALKKMLSDDSYYKRAKEISSFFRVRPVPPAKLVSHYVELAIQSKGAYHLRSKALLYKWYELWMLDQLALLLVILFVLYKSVKMIACLVINKFCKNCNKTNKKVKKN